MKRLLIVLFVASVVTQAQWSADPKVNTPLFTGPGSQSSPIGVSDGLGGAFVFWFHQETGATGIFAQRIDANGELQFPPPPPAPPTSSVQIYKRATTSIVYKDAIEDGAGGAIVTWSAAYSTSTTGSNIFAQHINGAGNTDWTPGGVTVCDSPGTQTMPRLVSVGTGGSIIVWEDHRGATGSGRVYAQCLDAGGNANAAWPAGGKLLSTKPSQSQTHPMVVPGDNNDAIVVWEDVTAFQQRLYAQKIDNAGAIQWADTGVAVYFYPTSPTLRGVVTDGAGGAYVCWQDRSSHGETNVYVQRIDGQGNRMWNPFGSQISNSGKDVNPLIVPDGSGGAIIAWEDSSLGIREVDIYAQRINSSGTLVWNSKVPVSNAAFEQYYFAMIPRGNDGAIIAWTDARSWPTPQGLDVYAQSLDNAGNLKWQIDGAPVSIPATASNPGSSQAFPKLITDNKGGAIAVWDDGRNPSTSTDIYTQGLSTLGLPFSQTIPIAAPNTNYAFIVGPSPALTVNFSALGSMDSMRVDAYLNATPPGLAKALPRYLFLASDGAGFDATLVFNYTDQEVQSAKIVNGDANVQLYRNEGSGWELQGGTVDTQANTITINNVTGFSLWAIRDPMDTLLTGVIERGEAPSSFVLYQNHPNPFNPSTTIRYQLSVDSWVTLKVYDIIGREVAILVNERQTKGNKKVEFDPARYKGVSSGVYLYKLTAGSFVDVKKMLMMR